jgi:hypothetical protein
MNDRSWFSNRADARSARERRAGRPGLVGLRGATASLVLLATGMVAGSGCSGYDKDTSPADEAFMATEAALCAAGPGQGDRCTEDCISTCHSGSGARVCTCEGGVFVACHCLPPEGWPYEPGQTAPYCDDVTGHPLALANELCEPEGAECISTAAPEQGCRCQRTTDGTKVAWSCNNAGVLGIPSDARSCESFGNGRSELVKKTSCTPWQLCVPRNYTEDATTPRGCVCIPEGNAQDWACGSTNRWFRPE